MIPSPIGASSSRPLANNDRPIVPTPIAKAVNFVCQGQEKFVALAQSPEEKPGRDSSAAGPKPTGGAPVRTESSRCESKSSSAEL